MFIHPARILQGTRSSIRPAVLCQMILCGTIAVFTALLCSCSGGATAAKDAPGGGRGGRKGGGDVPVTIALASKRDVPVELQVIGNVEAYSTITVKALVGGQLTGVYFHEGDFVKKDEKLFSSDPRP